MTKQITMQGEGLTGQLSVKVPEKVKRYLRLRAAIDNMISPSDVVRQAIDEYMKNHPIPNIGGNGHSK